MQFYELKNKVGATHETALHEMEPIHRGEVEDCRKCPACGAFIGSLRWLPPYRATVVAYGRELGDVAFFGDTILVSERFRQAWTDAGLKGIDAFQPLERLRVRPARLGRKTVTYYYVEVLHFGTRVDLQQSLIEYDKPYTCMTCFNEVGVDSVRGFKIDESSWTGEDIFEAWGMPGSIVVSERVKKLSEDYGLTNVTLIPIEEEFWDPYYRWSVIDYSPDEVAVPDEDEAEECTATN